MKRTEILKLFEDNRDKEVLLRAAELIKRGGVVVFPTETVYALSADAINEDAVKRIFRLKKREADKPIAIFILKPVDLKRFVREITAPAEKLIKAFWPGPLTLIFQSKPGQMTYITSRDEKLGVRVSSSRFVQSLLTRTKTPLTATSANLSGNKEPVSADEVSKDFDGKINLIVDGGLSLEATPSSVVDVSADIPIILREGRILFEQMKKIVPELRKKVNYGK